MRPSPHRPGVNVNVEPFRAAIELLSSIPASKSGRDRDRLGDRHRHERFPSAGHLISWAGLCPRNDESAGKRRSNRMKKGALAEDHADPMRMGSIKEENSYLQVSV